MFFTGIYCGPNLCLETRTYPYCDARSVCTGSDCDRHPNSNGRPNPDEHARTHADIDSYPYSHSHADRDQYADPHADRDQYADPHADRDQYADPHSDPITYSYSSPCDDRPDTDRLSDLPAQGKGVIREWDALARHRRRREYGRDA